MQRKSDTFLLVLDLIGTFVFAIEGAMAGVRADLDLLGLLVLSFVTALGGGIIRDVLLGDTPPASIRNWHYPAVAFAGGAAAFFFYRAVQNIPAEFLLILDAAGLGLFAVAGAAKGLAAGINPLIAVLLGGVTGVGGGTVRDILLARIPTVLRADVYATAALLGAVVLVLGVRLGGSRGLMSALGATSCFTLRLAAALFHWNLPKITMLLTTRSIALHL